MVALVGLNPFAFHAVTLIMHLLVLTALYLVLRAVGFTRTVALLASALFGMMPLHVTQLSSAVGVNDEAALLFALLALLLSLRGKRLLAGATYLVALLSKESVFFLPFLLLVARREGESWHVVRSRVWIHLVIACVFGMSYLVLRRSGLGPAGDTYSLGFGANLFHNLMTYTAWAVDLRNAMPDMLSSYDPKAWHVAIWVYAGLVLVLWRIHGGRFALRFGLTWWVLGLLPVLLLQFQTYRHYVYPALPGLAVAFATVIAALLTALSKLVARTPRLRAAATAFLVAAVLGAYAARADHLIDRRMSALVPGTNLPLDPAFRKRIVAQRALGSFYRQLPSARTLVGIFSPEGVGEMFGTGSGRQYAVRPNSGAYDLLRESVDDGGAIRLFFPQVDSVVFLGRWTPAYQDFELYLPYANGFLMGVGTGSAAHEEVSRWMLQAGWYRQARDHLKTVLETYPRQPSLRLAYAGALFKLGDRKEAIAQLMEVIRIAPRDSSGAQARLILSSMSAGSLKSDER